MSDSASNSIPFEWLELELLPLPGAEETPAQILWWNIVDGSLVGEASEEITDLINSAKAKGELTTANGQTIQISNPFHDTTEMAAILAQFYWVAPKPVAKPNYPTLH